MFSGNFIHPITPINPYQCYRRELIPEDPSDLVLVNQYIKERINFFIRKSPEYPIITPSNIHANEFYQMAVMSRLSHTLSDRSLDNLDIKFTRILKDYQAEDIRLQKEIARNRIKLENLENLGPSIEDEESKSIRLSLVHDIARTKYRAKSKKEVIEKLEIKNRKLHQIADTQQDIIGKKVKQLSEIENDVKKICLQNRIDISNISFSNSKIECEISLLQHQIEATETRIQLCANRAGLNLNEEEQNESVA